MRIHQYGLRFMWFKSYGFFIDKVSHLAKSLSFPFLLSLLFVACPAQASTFKIVGFGDSLMAGYQLEAGAGVTDRLEYALQQRGIDATVANAGVSGDTTSSGLSRLDWSVPDDTDLVILELGANDMLRGIMPEVTAANLDRMITRLQERKIPVLLVGMFAAPNLGADFQARFDAIYPELSSKHALPLIPFFLEGVTGDPDLVLDDGMHPNAKGVDRMVETVLPQVEAIIKRSPHK